MRPSILIIEDEPDLADLLKTRLDASGFDCTAVYTAKDGIERAGTLNPNLILLDLALPDMSGLWLLRELKANLKLKSIPVVILSALSDEKIVEQGFNLGATSYLVKTCNSEELISTVRDHVQ